MYKYSINESVRIATTATTRLQSSGIAELLFFFPIKGCSPVSGRTRQNCWWPAGLCPSEERNFPRLSCVWGVSRSSLVRPISYQKAGPSSSLRLGFKVQGLLVLAFIPNRCRESTSASDLIPSFG